MNVLDVPEKEYPNLIESNIRTMKVAQSGVLLEPSKSRIDNPTIIGPITYVGYFIPLPKPRIIHLFGETHKKTSEEYTCSEDRGISFEQFLTDQVSWMHEHLSSEKLDLFIERQHDTGTKDIEIGTNQDKLNTVMETALALKPKYNNLRIHGVDIRYEKKSATYPVQLILDMLLPSTLLKNVETFWGKTPTDIEEIDPWLNSIIESFKEGSFYKLYLKLPRKSDGTVKKCEAPGCTKRISMLSYNGKYCSLHCKPGKETESDSKVNWYMEDIKRRFPVIYNKLLGINDVIYMEFPDLFSSRMKKQYQTIPENIRNVILRSFEELFNDWKVIMEKNLDECLKTYLKISKEVIQNVECFIQLGGLAQDIYTMGRLFRNFEKGTYPKISMVYAGSNHITHMNIVFAAWDIPESHYNLK